MKVYEIVYLESAGVILNPEEMDYSLNSASSVPFILSPGPPTVQTSSETPVEHI